MGTVSYYAPELLLPEESYNGFDEKIDSWCIGLIFHELLVNRLPFEIEDTHISVQKKWILNENIDFTKNPKIWDPISDAGNIYIKKIYFLYL